MSGFEGEEREMRGRRGCEKVALEVASKMGKKYVGDLPFQKGQGKVEMELQVFKGD